MKLTILPLTLLVLMAVTGTAQDSKFPSLPSEVFSNYAPQAPEIRSPGAMAAQAQTFLDSLDDDLRGQASLPYDSIEKSRWTNVPPRGPQGGVRLGDLSEGQLKLAFDLLATVLSPQGFAKARGIPLADDRLLRNGERRPGFGAEDYWLAIFGKPSAETPWAIQFDGHHLAINLAFHGTGMSLSPTFIGTQPREFKLNKNTVEPMAGQDAAGLAFLRTLGAAQQGEAILGKKRGNLVAGAGRDGVVPDAVGISCENLNKAQESALMNIIKLYVNDLPEPFSTRRLEELSAEIDRMTFAWWGPVKDDGDYSYRIQGPTLIIEFAGQDLGGDPHDHLHSMYRDPTNEYGARLGGQ